jgi:hypothetical protein
MLACLGFRYREYSVKSGGAFYADAVANDLAVLGMIFATMGWD